MEPRDSDVTCQSYSSLPKADQRFDGRYISETQSLYLTPERRDKCIALGKDNLGGQRRVARMQATRLGQNDTIVNCADSKRKINCWIWTRNSRHVSITAGSRLAQTAALPTAWLSQDKGCHVLKAQAKCRQCLTLV